MHQWRELSSDFCSQVDAAVALIMPLISIITTTASRHMDDICFTSRHLSIYTFLRLFRTRRLDSLCQFKQVGHSKQRATCSHHDEYIHRSSISPTRWHRP